MLIDGIPALRTGVDHLSRIDTGLAAVVRAHGPPPLWRRPPGFETLVRIILEQQVSLASGRAAHGRARRAAGGMTPAAIARCGEDGLRKAGVTRQKAGFCVGLARSVMEGAVDLERIAALPDGEASLELQSVKGVGPWTADVYLLMALGRPDIWPSGDVALQTAIGTLRNLEDRPDAARAADLADVWRPWRAVAARILWHGYIEGSLRPG